MSDPLIPPWMKETEAAPSELAAPPLPSESPQVPPPKRAQSLSLVLQRVWSDRKEGFANWTPPQQTKVRLSNLSLYVRKLGMMLNAGLPIVHAFELLSLQGDDKRLQKASLEVKNDLLTGTSLTVAMGRHPEVFPPLFLFSIQSAEVAGTVPASLKRLAEYYEREHMRLQKIRAALVYPAFVFCFAVITFFVLIGTIFPLFSQFFQGMHFQLPFITRFLLAFFNLLTLPVFWIFTAGFSIVSFALWKIFSRRPAFALRVNIWQLQLPMIGPLMQKLATSQFCRATGMMLEAGVFILTVLEVLRKGIGMPVFKILLFQVEDDLRSGIPLAQALEEFPIFPRVVRDLVRIGEESGNLQILLRKAADYLDIEAQILMQNLTALIEPALIIFLGIMVGTILIGIFLPLYGAIGQLQ